jgi:hypothetical protein
MGQRRVGDPAEVEPEVPRAAPRAQDQQVGVVGGVQKHLTGGTLRSTLVQPHTRRGLTERGLQGLHRPLLTYVCRFSGQPWVVRGLVRRNFVARARARAEIEAAHASWSAQDERFGRVRSSLPLIPAKAPFWQQAGENR